MKTFPNVVELSSQSHKRGKRQKAVNYDGDTTEHPAKRIRSNGEENLAKTMDCRSSQPRGRWLTRRSQNLIAFRN